MIKNGVDAMPKIISVGICPPPHIIDQRTVVHFAKDLFGDAFKDIKRLLQVFENGQIEKRHIAKELSWFENDHTFEEKNNAYIECSIKLGAQAIENCVTNKTFLKQNMKLEEIEALFYISSTGLATPTIDARIMNVLPFSSHTKRIPLWGLGCAGGAAGLARAFEYCKAFPKAKVLVLAVELCSLTFQRNDLSKSNLIGTSLFADGAACALIAGDEVDISAMSSLSILPSYIDSQSTLMKDSEDVMGWDVRNEGLYVIFSKDIPSIISTWFHPNVKEFLMKNHTQLSDLSHFIVHPGGKKVLEAYEYALGIDARKMQISFDILREYGNMSSATVLYVLQKYVQTVNKSDELGLIGALGPGFSSELVLLRWENIQ